MQEPNLFKLFITPLNRYQISYIITGSVAVIIYGEPRLTHDIDFVVELSYKSAGKIVEAFPFDQFYCPPLEIIKIETRRAQRGHFNIIHHSTGYKADIYLCGTDELHRWALSKKIQYKLDDEIIWLAPPEYVILRKLEFYREGQSDKHLRDVRSILEISSFKIDFDFLQKEIINRRLEIEWEKVK